MENKNNEPLAYQFTKEIFFKNIINYLNGFDINPKSIFHFGIKLPFQIGLPPGGMLSFPDKDRCITLFIYNICEKEPIWYVNNRTESHVIEKIYTCVEVIITTSEKGLFYSLQEEDYSDLFDQGLGKINHLLKGYVLTFDDSDIYYINLSHLFPITLIQIIDVETWDINRMQFVVNYNAPVEKEVLTADQIKKVVYAIAKFSIMKLNPYTIVRELQLSATRFYESGEYREAIIHSNMSFELLLQKLLYEFYLVEGKDELILSELYLRNGLKKIVQQEFHMRIGGNWNLKDNQNSPIGLWYNLCYLKRNHIIHSGYLPSKKETQEALDTSFRAASYAVSLINQKEKYKHILAYFT